ncbi:MAG: AAA family ATPase [Clostridia bacterium]|nr:AAA family ATPase [Clostridia bacterium]
MANVIAIANQKGGVGKTSTTVNLGAGLIRQGYDVLLIDLDSQANLTMALGFQNPDDMEYTVSNVLHKAVKEEQIYRFESMIGAFSFLNDKGGSIDHGCAENLFRSDADEIHLP